MFTRWAVLFMAGAMVSVDGAPVDYLREVKPILAEHCHRCHGASQQKHGLRLDTAALARKGGEHGPAIEPGRGGESLVMRVLKGEHESVPRMPYKKAPLAAAQVELIGRWIDEGATAPADEQADRNLHWAFVPPTRPPVPDLAKTGARKRRDRLRVAGSAHPIDAFIVARLGREGIRVSPEADRVTLIRRLSLDLTGLPPTPSEVDAFVGDRSWDAYEKVVDRLLASPHYGERWGRHWLDAARYADSNGYSIDAPRSLWKYRDWVVDALNRDMPFDRFTIWQIAGDLIDTNSLAGAPSLEPLIATGFHRNTQINQEGGIDPEQFRVESVIDRVNTTATTWLGVTLACAQCHDHKFDPLTQREYYRFYAFFNSTVEDGHGKGSPEGMLELPGENEDASRDRAEATVDLERYLDTKGSELLAWEQSLTEDQRARLGAGVREALGVPFAGRTARQKRITYAAFRPDDPEFKQRDRRLARLERNTAKPVTTLVMRELDKPRETRVFIKGDFTRPADTVTPGTPAILHPLNIPSGRGTTNRLDLARWLVDTNNPLTARVTVNRIWQHYFGRGLVETENDFGTQGSPPSHPELLDWLAYELMHPTQPPQLPTRPPQLPNSQTPKLAQLPTPTPQLPNSQTPQLPTQPPQLPNSQTPQLPPPSWSLKHIHRLIVTSAAYRRSSKARPDLAVTDPDNRLLARQNRVRLDAEIVRDVSLAASGLLNGRLGGPGVFPPQPAGVMNLGQSNREWKPSAGPNRYRRGMYTYFWRATPHPSLMVFDAADGFSACTRRVRSNTPLQALTLLNDEAFHECARALAARVLREGPADDAGRVDYAFRLCVARSPGRDERRRLLDLIGKERSEAEVSAAWTTVSRVLLNLDETITRE